MNINQFNIDTLFNQLRKKIRVKSTDTPNRSFYTLRILTVCVKFLGEEEEWLTFNPCLCGFREMLKKS